MENKVFSTDPAGRAQLDSLRALHRSYPENESMAALLVSLLSEEMINDPVQFMPEIERVLEAPCFAHDTPRKYLTRAVFYRGGTLLGQAKVPHSDGKGNWANKLEQFGEGLREAAAALENLFPDSEECHALQVAMMIDSYLLSGDDSIREEVNLLLEGAAGAAGESDVGLALKAAHANAIEGLEWGHVRAMPLGEGLAQEYFAELFTLNLGTLLKMMEAVDDFEGEDKNQATFVTEPEIRAPISEEAEKFDPEGTITEGLPAQILKDQHETKLSDSKSKTNAGKNIPQTFLIDETRERKSQIGDLAKNIFLALSRNIFVPFKSFKSGCLTIFIILFVITWVGEYFASRSPEYKIEKDRLESIVTQIDNAIASNDISTAKNLLYKLYWDETFVDSVKGKSHYEELRKRYLKRLGLESESEGKIESENP